MMDWEKLFNEKMLPDDKQVEERKKTLETRMQEYEKVLNEHKGLLINNKFKAKYFQKIISDKISEIENIKNKITEELKSDKLKEFVIKGQKLNHLGIYNSDFLTYPIPNKFDIRRITSKYHWLLDLPVRLYRPLVQDDNISCVFDYTSIREKNIILYIKKLKSAGERWCIHSIYLQEVLSSYKNKYKAASLTLFIREIEGLITELMKFINEKYNYEISFERCYSLTSKIEKFEDKDNKFFKEIGFLCGIYSTERNSILHGESVNFEKGNDKWIELLFVFMKIMNLYENYKII